MSSSKTSSSSLGSSVVVFIGIVLLLIYAKELLIPVAFSLVLALLLLPFVSWLEGKGLSKTIAVMVASVVTGAVLLVGAYVLVVQVISVGQTLPAYRANIEKRVDTLHVSAAHSIGGVLSVIDEMTGHLGVTPGDTTATPVRLVGQRSERLNATESFVSDALHPVAELSVVLIFTMYMLMNWDELRHRLLLVAGMGNINLMTRALDDATERISLYLVMQLQVNACYGLLFGGGLFVIGIPNAPLWGVIAGVLRIIPFVGTFIGMLLPLILSVAMSSNWVPPLCVLALFVVLEMSATNLIEPWLFSSRTGISSLALLASAIFWSMLWGWPGLVLSTPLTVCVVVLGRYVPNLAFLHSLLGTNAKLSPAAHLYERLLAMDEAEASAIAEKYLKENTVVKLYETVIMPALRLAEDDKHKGALDTHQRKFILLWMADLLARLASFEDRVPEKEQVGQTGVFQILHTSPRKEVAVVCLSAGDRAAELSTEMLAQLLERAGHQTLTLRPDGISDDILTALAAEEDTIVVISALPPFAFAQTRALYHRVRSHMPRNRVAVAMWNATEENDEIAERFGSARPNVVVKNLSQTVRQVAAWQHDTRMVV